MALDRRIGRHWQKMLLTDSLSTPREVGSKSTAIVDSTGANDINRLASELRLLALADVDTGWDQNAGRDVAGVSSTLTGLGADKVATDVEGLLDVLGVANHVHDGDASLVQLVDGPNRGNTDSADEELGLLLNDDVEELWELALGVVVLSGSD